MKIGFLLLDISLRHIILRDINSFDQLNNTSGFVLPL